MTYAWMHCFSLLTLPPWVSIAQNSLPSHIQTMFFLITLTRNILLIENSPLSLGLFTVCFLWLVVLLKLLLLRGLICSIIADHGWLSWLWMVLMFKDCWVYFRFLNCPYILYVVVLSVNGCVVLKWLNFLYMAVLSKYGWVFCKWRCCS